MDGELLNCAMNASTTETTMTLTHGSLFAGFGGIDFGFAQAGIKTIWAVEKRSFPRKVLRKNFQGIKLYGDIRRVGTHNLRTVDILSGGFPCQPSSTAGSRKGTSDSRWLWPEMFRVICAIRPRWVVAENVYGLCSLEAGRILDSIYSQLESEDFECLPPLVIPASSFGAPHIRYRVWIIAHTNKRRCSESQGDPDAAFHQNWDGEAHREERSSITNSTFPIHANVPNATCGRREEQYVPARSRTKGQGTPHIDGRCEILPDAAGQRCGQMEQSIRSGANGEGTASQIADSSFARRRQWWDSESGICRVVDGVPNRVERLRGLGNSVVTQMSEWIGRQIIEVDSKECA